MFVVDYSYAHDQITPAELHKIGAAGVIGYAGCADTDKCLTGPEVRALLNAGLWVGLVIENGPRDALDGASAGATQGAAIVAAAKTLGYDWQDCVLFAGADFNETSTGQYTDTLAFMEAFAEHVPVPGYYGDSDSIDYLHARHPDWTYWQSESASFSPRNPTPNAALHQRYNDPRAGSLRQAVDVNDVLKQPLNMMGETVKITAADLDPTALTAIAHANWAYNQNGARDQAWAYLQAAAKDQSLTKAMVSAITAAVEAGIKAAGSASPEQAVIEAAVEAGMKKAFADAAS